jgi:hypothetical protein
VTVRVDEPLLAVMVTEVELVACQLKVTLWPLMMEVALAEKVTVGSVCITAFELFAQEQEPHKARSRGPQESLRKRRSIICSCRVPGAGPQHQMPGPDLQLSEE